MIVPFFISHRGCPHQCVFCNQQRISGAEGTLPEACEILDRITVYTASGRKGPVEVAFYGGTFTSLARVDQERMLFPLRPLLASGAVSAVRVSTRPDAIDAETVAFLRENGVGIVEVGVQSMDDEVLAMAGRGHVAADVERAAAVLQDAGIAVGVQLMPGLPGDTPAVSLHSLRRVLRLHPAFIRIYPTVVVDGTVLADMYRSGRYSPLGLSAAVSLCKIMLHEAMKADVPVIRIGLQPTADLEAPGAVLAGPWHPAFRQLVEGELLYDLAERLTAGFPGGSEVSIICAPSRVSDVVGQRRRNLERLRDHRGVRVTGVAGSTSLSPFALEIVHSGGTIAGNILEHLTYEQEVASFV